MAGIRPILKGWMLVSFMIMISTHPSTPTRAGFGGQPLGDIAWSPDGSMIVGVGTTSEPVIYAVQADGTVTIQNENIDRLFAGGNYFPNTYERAIAWSPDGTQFAVMSESLYSPDENYIPHARLLLFDASAPQSPITQYTVMSTVMTLLPSLFWTDEGLLIPAYVEGEGTLVFGVSPKDLTTYERIGSITAPTDSIYYPMAINGDYVASLVRSYVGDALAQQINITYFTDAPASAWIIALNADDDFTQIAWGENTDIALAGRDSAIELYYGRMDDPNFASLRGYFMLPDDAADRTIVDLDWSADGAYLAAVDDTGDVFLWTGEGQAVNLSASEIDSTLVIDWHPQDPLLALGFWNGEVGLIDLSE